MTDNQGATTMSATDYDKMSASEKKKEDWMNAKWRPMMGWIYMITCITDFILFPVLWSILQAAYKQPITPWNPITLQGAGLFHLAMGAIIGVAAYGRTQEKLAGANNGGLPVPGATPAVPGSFVPPATTTVVTQTYTPTPQVGSGLGSGPISAGFGGKKAPPEPEFYPER